MWPPRERGSNLEARGTKENSIVLAFNYPQLLPEELYQKILQEKKTLFNLKIKTISFEMILNPSFYKAQQSRMKMIKYSEFLENSWS